MPVEHFQALDTVLGPLDSVQIDRTFVRLPPSAFHISILALRSKRTLWVRDGKDPELSKYFFDGSFPMLAGVPV